MCSVPDPVQQIREEDTLGSADDEVDEQARSSQNLSTSTAEISSPPSEDSDRMNSQVENDDGLGLVQSDTSVGAADGESAQITSSLAAFSVSSMMLLDSGAAFIFVMIENFGAFFLAFIFYSAVYFSENFDILNDD
jgi:hypothetical protein